MDFKELKPKTEGLYDSCYKTNDREELKEIALNAIYVAHNDVDIINELLDRLGEDEKIEYLQDLMKFKKAPYDFVVNNYTSIPIELLREIALNAVYVANDDKAVQKEIDDRKIEKNNIPTEEEWVGKMKDTNGTFFDVYQHGDKFYDVLGNELDKEEVKNFVIKNTKTESVMDLPNGQDDCNSFKNYQAFVNNFGELIILKDKYDKNWKVYTPDRTEPNDYIYYADTRDNIEGWLYGAVMANNGAFKNLKSESLEENKEDEYFGYTIQDDIEEYNGPVKKDRFIQRAIDYGFNYDNNKEDKQKVDDYYKEYKSKFKEIKTEYKELQPITEAPDIEMKTTGTILDDIKDALNKRCGDVLTAETAKVDGVVGLKLTRKGKQDLIYLFDKIRDQLSAAGIDPQDYEIDLKGDNLLLAMKNMAI